jgi:hypothetical protein
VNKPKFAITPRKPVSDEVARLLEEAIERKSEAVAGSPPVAPPQAAVVPSAAPVEPPSTPRPTLIEQPAPRATLSPEVSQEAVSPAPRSSVRPANETPESSGAHSEQRVKLKSDLNPARLTPRAPVKRTQIAQSEPETTLGTVKNPRIRKRDGVATRSTSIHFPVDLAFELTMYCAQTGLGQSEAVTEAVAEYLRSRR